MEMVLNVGVTFFCIRTIDVEAIVTHMHPGRLAVTGSSVSVWFTLRKGSAKQERKKRKWPKGQNAGEKQAQKWKKRIIFSSSDKKMIQRQKKQKITEIRSPMIFYSMENYYCYFPQNFVYLFISPYVPAFSKVPRVMPRCTFKRFCCSRFAGSTLGPQSNSTGFQMGPRTLSGFPRWENHSGTEWWHSQPH